MKRHGNASTLHPAGNSAATRAFAPFILFTLFTPFTLLLLTLCPSAFAAERNAKKSSTDLVTPSAERAIERGLKWLAAGQHDDGSFGSGPARGNVAVTSLSAMAMMASGSTPGRGPHGARINRAIDYVLGSSQPSGFITGADASRGPMYGHGFATMLLAECYGMSPRPELREKLTKAVKIIVESQNKEGGWRYMPVRGDGDISVTVCELMALRAAHNAGLFVPAETIDRAVGYIKPSQNADGGFMYMIQGGESAFPRSAAAVAALQSAGVYKGDEITKGLDYLKQFQPGSTESRPEGYYFYGHYYAAQAMWQAGGERWRRWYPAIRDDLVARQRDDGSWLATEGNECGTAMSCLVLQLPNDYLPIFQR